MWRLMLLTSFVILVGKGNSLTERKECPESEVHPCYCYYLSGQTYMTCQNFTDSEALRRVFSKSQSHEYTVVVIEDSILEYLPHEIIDSIRLRELQVKKTTLQQAFDQTPVALDSLHALIIDDVTIERDSIWDLLQPMESLRSLYIINHPIETLGRDFSDHVPKHLVALSLYKTETRKILPGTFAELKKLVKIEVDGGQIEVLTRDIFPTPFNGRYIFFNDQKLKEIPDGLFSQMPNLCTVSLKKNQIATLPETAFDRDITRKKILSSVGVR
ncbi:unnamed protein product [Larinioides sclopetarius]|uniref:Uncharacterized protein n=1 Tax=Larinioides sclopetarius TaxID=280406 RepID=A0AAV2BY51_9ARAC